MIVNHVATRLIKIHLRPSNRSLPEAEDLPRAHIIPIPIHQQQHLTAHRQPRPPDHARPARAAVRQATLAFVGPEGGVGHSDVPARKMALHAASCGDPSEGRLRPEHRIVVVLPAARGAPAARRHHLHRVPNHHHGGVLIESNAEVCREGKAKLNVVVEAAARDVVRVEAHACTQGRRARVVTTMRSDSVLRQ